MRCPQFKLKRLVVSHRDHSGFCTLKASVSNIKLNKSACVKISASTFHAAVSESEHIIRDFSFVNMFFKMCEAMERRDKETRQLVYLAGCSLKNRFLYLYFLYLYQCFIGSIWSWKIWSIWNIRVPSPATSLPPLPPTLYC